MESSQEEVTETEEPTEIWEAPDGSFAKIVVTKGFGFFTPQDGSVCKVGIINDEHSLIQPLDSDNIKDVIIGEADTDIDRIFESCIRTMKEEEICELIFKQPVLFDDNEEELSIASSEEPKSPTIHAKNQNSKEDNECDDSNKNTAQGMESGNASTQSVGDNASEVTEEKKGCDATSVKVKLQLLVFSREPEIWEMSITEKWRRASHHKVQGVELFTARRYKWAFRRFSVSLRYLISLEHDIPPEHNCDEQGMDIKGLKVSCYLNIAACQLKHGNYSSAVKNCTKALELDSNNIKALYRRAVGLIHIQEYEKAKDDLDKIFEMEPNHPAATKQQKKLNVRVQKLNAYYADAMKKMFI